MSVLVKKVKSLFIKEKKESLQSKILRNSKYVFFLIIIFILLKYYPSNKLQNMELMIIVLSTTLMYITFDIVSPSKKIMC